MQRAEFPYPPAVPKSEGGSIGMPDRVLATHTMGGPTTVWYLCPGSGSLAGSALAVTAALTARRGGKGV